MSWRNDVVVTHADLSESSDNKAVGDLLDEHTIAEGKEPIPLPYRLLIRPHDIVFAGEGADEHDEGGFGEVKIRDKGIGGLEFISGINENCGFG